MSMTLYVQAKSKKEINERLATGKPVLGDSYGMFGNEGCYALDSKLPNGTVIKVYEKFVGGSPYAKTYGTWNVAKNKVM